MWAKHEEKAELCGDEKNAAARHSSSSARVILGSLPATQDEECDYEATAQDNQLYRKDSGTYRS